MVVTYFFCLACSLQHLIYCPTSLVVLSVPPPSIRTDRGHIIHNIDIQVTYQIWKIRLHQLGSNTQPLDLKSNALHHRPRRQMEMGDPIHRFIWSTNMFAVLPKSGRETPPLRHSVNLGVPIGDGLDIILSTVCFLESLFKVYKRLVCGVSC